MSCCWSCSWLVGEESMDGYRVVKRVRGAIVDSTSGVAEGEAVAVRLLAGLSPSRIQDFAAKTDTDGQDVTDRPTGPRQRGREFHMQIYQDKNRSTASENMVHSYTIISSMFYAMLCTHERTTHRIASLLHCRTTTQASQPTSPCSPANKKHARKKSERNKTNS